MTKTGVMRMRHAIEYEGPYDENILRVRGGATSYVKRDGSAGHAFRGPKSVDGVKFGMLELPWKEFRIARVMFGSSDIPLVVPIPAKGTGPSGKLLTLAQARRILETARDVNRLSRKELTRILKELR
jgi:hypothetical protein